MTSDDKSRISRRSFQKLAAGAAVSAAASGVAAASEEPATDQHSQTDGGYDYDVVIVGGGCAGALAASELSKARWRVLILESGKELRHPVDNLGKFYGATAKIPESPWRTDTDKRANSPTVLDMGSNKEDANGTPDWLLKTHYLIQHDKCAKGDEEICGPEYVPFNSTYTRLGGGSTNHWQGVSLRFVQDDFKLRSTYLIEDKDDPRFDPQFQEYAKDWPITYNDLECWYGKAEHEVGIAGDVAYDNNLGIPHDYHEDYPMPPIALCYQDMQFKEALKNKEVNGRKVKVLAIPQARNSVDRDGRPKCQGNSSCIPICPIQAKYDATFHLKKAAAAGARIEYQSVAYRVVLDENDKVSKIKYKQWGSYGTADREVTARTYVLAAHAIETAKLLLISPWKKSETKDRNFVSVANSSDKVGRHLMDHIIYIAWGVAANPVYPYRGPLSTAGIGDFRGGPQEDQEQSSSKTRKDRAAYRIHIANDSWNWPVPPELNAQTLINEVIDVTIRELAETSMELNTWTEGEKNKFLDDLGLSDKGIAAIKLRMHEAGDRDYEQDSSKKPFGKRLQRHIRESMIRQVRLGAEVEALPLPDSRVTVSDQIGEDGSFVNVPPEERDALGIPKPQVHYRISKYSERGFADSVETLTQILELMHVKPIHRRIIDQGSATQPDSSNGQLPKYVDSIGEHASEVFTHENIRYQYGGAGHIMGTYRMGDDPTESVCDKYCCSHDHKNLYLLGSGVFPSAGTANPTLTIMALAMRAAHHIALELEGKSLEVDAASKKKLAECPSDQ